MTKQSHVMVVTPHPDDAEYGVAGTVARWTRQGKQVIYVVCTNGDKGTSDVNLKPEQLADIREKEQPCEPSSVGSNTCGRIDSGRSQDCRSKGIDIGRRQEVGRDTGEIEDTGQNRSRLRVRSKTQNLSSDSR